MAIVDCPSCGKKTSDMMSVCAKCGARYEPPGETGVETRQMLRRGRDRKYAALVHIYLAILVTTAGVVWFWFSSEQMSQPAGLGAQMTLATGIVWYVAARVYGVWIK